MKITVDIHTINVPALHQAIEQYQGAIKIANIEKEDY